MIIYVDIDETICNNESNREYSKARPINENIAKINDLYDKGHKIVNWSARGSTTGIDWNKMTKNQLERWGAKYHKLSVGDKPDFDVLIDDKAININSLDSSEI